MSKPHDARSDAPEGAIPKATVGRLSLYLRQLDLLRDAGAETVSSSQLGKALGITDAQVRKDLAYFGQFGFPGVGYRVVVLREALKQVLGVNRVWRACLVGVGNLGRALLGYQGFRRRGFQIAALFDADPHLVGRQLQEMIVHGLDDLPQGARELGLELAILAVPAPAAPKVAQVVVAAGIQGILNFAPVPLQVPKELRVVSVDLGQQLEQLAFQVTQRGGVARPFGAPADEPPND